MSSDKKEILYQKLDEFIRKYYKNELIKGSILFGGITLALFITLLLSEYFGRFGTPVRTILFYFFLVSTSYILFRYIIKPFSGLFGIGKRMSYEDAASLIGGKLTDVKDKLLNTLQLTSNAHALPLEHMELVYASINQRIKTLSPVPFASVINLSENRRQLKYFLLPLLLFLGIWIYNSDMIKEPTKRLMYHGTYFETPAPFKFEVLNDELTVIQNEDFLLEVTLSGKEIPERVYVQIDENNFKLDKQNKTTFSYRFRNVNVNQKFILKADEVHSSTFELVVLPKPVLMNFEAQLVYPAYINRQKEILKNTGDLIIPEGTQINWRFLTVNTANLYLQAGDSALVVKKVSDKTFESAYKAHRSIRYAIHTENNLVKNPDTVKYSLTVVKDEYPRITVEEKIDSNSVKQRYFSGAISDDYGFTRLTFNFRKLNRDRKAEPFKSIEIKLNRSFNREEFFYYWKMDELELKPEESVEYFFQVWDNDGVNGAKVCRSPVKVFQAPSLDEIAENTEKGNKEIKENLASTLSKASQLQKDFQNLKNDLLQKKNTDWQDRAKLEDLLNKHQSVQNDLEKIKQQTEKNFNQQKDFTEPDPELLKKQEELQKLFDELMSDEMKKLFEELQQLMDKLNKDKLLEKLENFDFSNEGLKKQLDRSLEIFKQVEFDQKLENLIQKTEALAKQQEELSKQIENKAFSKEQAEQKQKALNDKFDKLKEDQKELLQLNEELENKRTTDDFKEENQQIDQEQQNSMDNLQKNNQKKAAQNQKKAAEKMQEMANKMKQMQREDQQQSIQEDLKSLRLLLANLIEFSFQQEELMEKFKFLNDRDPAYVGLGQQQRKLQNDSKVLADSLEALAKRVPQLSSYISREMGEIQRYFSKLPEDLTERRTSEVRRKQQSIMMHANNLALMLNEAMEQMQNSMSMASGSGSCDKPGGSGSSKTKPMSIPTLKDMQQQLSQQLEKMKQQMEKGEQEGGKSPGKKGEGEEGESNKSGGQKLGGKGGSGGANGEGEGEGQPSMSEGLAKLAAQQAALREQLQRLAQELNQDGTGRGNSLKKIAEEMEKLEEDIVNKRIDNNTMKRQRDIMTRLLEHEKAEREREFDNKREGKSAEDIASDPKEFLEYKRKKEKEIELLKTIPPSLKPYYKNLVNGYFNEVD
ncbi:MAG: DUF4175 family protein [Flavobacteriales bacterium]